MNREQSWFVGECMVELRRAGPHVLAQAFAGDVYNTAVYFRHLHVSCQACFISSVGMDSVSDALLDEAATQGLNLQYVMRLSGQVPGLYLIETAQKGERSFLYWRSHSAARLMLDESQFRTLYEHIENCGLLYFSGITLAILDDQRRERLLRLAHAVREKGAYVGFDTNYRPQLWNDKRSALAWTNAALATASHVLVTLDDEIALHGDADAMASLSRIFAAGANEVVIKLGAQGCLAQSATMTKAVAIPAEKIEPVDTTAAGDSFNAAYLAARLKGRSIEEAARSGCSLAALVVTYPGAIMDKDRIASIHLQ